MKVQLRSVEELEEIFKELLCTQEGEDGQALDAAAKEGPGREQAFTPEELDVLMHAKELFIHNVQVDGEEVDFGTLARERLDRRKVDAKLIGQLEEKEAEKLHFLKELCRVRRELPVLLREEVEDNHRAMLEGISKEVGILLEGREVQGAADALDEEGASSGVANAKQALQELKTKLPSLIERVEKELSAMEEEIKGSLLEKKAQSEAEALSLLFRDGLEM